MGIAWLVLSAHLYVAYMRLPNPLERSIRGLKQGTVIFTFTVEVFDV